MSANTQVTIWDRVLASPSIPPVELARYLLRLAFKDEDQQRMHALLTRARRGTLTAEEMAEAEEYRRASDLLTLLQSKARLALRQAG